MQETAFETLLQRKFPKSLRNKGSPEIQEHSFSSKLPFGYLAALCLHQFAIPYKKELVDQQRHAFPSACGQPGSS